MSLKLIKLNFHISDWLFVKVYLLQQTPLELVDCSTNMGSWRVAKPIGKKEIIIVVVVVVFFAT